MAKQYKASSAENGPAGERAVAYLRTSSAANVGGDSDKRQREAIQAYASRAGLVVAAEFYDAAVSGADPLDRRVGFTDALAYAKEHGIGIVMVETASRFARSLTVQELGLQMLRREGVRKGAKLASDCCRTGGAWACQRDGKGIFSIENATIVDGFIDYTL